MKTYTYIYRVTSNWTSELIKAGSVTKAVDAFYRVQDPQIKGIDNEVKKVEFIGELANP